MTQAQFLLFFLAGLAGSMHCIGMCGGFACGLGTDPRGHAATLRRHLIYNLGRVSSYCFLGAVVGHLGLLLVGHDGDGSAGSTAQRALAVLSGALMVFMGLQFFGLFARAHRRLGPGAQALTQALRTLVKAPGAAAPLALGALNGLLPCPLVYAFAAQAAASGGPLSGLQVMAAFGLGTFPAMLAMGGVGLWWRRGARPLPAQSARVFWPTGPLAPSPLWGEGGGEGPPARRHGRTALTPALSQREREQDVLPRPAARTGRGFLADWRLQGVRLAGGFIVLLGLVTLARGLLPMSAHLH